MSTVQTLQLLMPLPKSNWGGCCVLCDKAQARWTIRGQSASISVCGLCILYASPWGQRNSERIAATIDSVEKARAVPMPVGDGKLFRCEDADSVLGVLVLVDRTVSRMPT